MVRRCPLPARMVTFRQLSCRGSFSANELAGHDGWGRHPRGGVLRSPEGGVGGFLSKRGAKGGVLPFGIAVPPFGSLQCRPLGFGWECTPMAAEACGREIGGSPAQSMGRCCFHAGVCVWRCVSVFRLARGAILRENLFIFILTCQCTSNWLPRIHTVSQGHTQGHKAGPR